MLAPVAQRRAALESRFTPWSALTLHGALDRAVQEFGDRPYVVTDEAVWTYRDVQERSLSLAKGLRALGVAPGENVALLMANFPEFVPVKYAVSRVGATCVPVNFLNKRDELGYVLRQSDAVLLVTMDEFRGLNYLAMLDELSPGWEKDGGGQRLPSLREVVVLPTSDAPVRAGVTSLAALAGLGQEQDLQDVPVSPGADSDIIYTSGTTGNPKGVRLTHDMLTRTSYGAAFSRAFEDGRRVAFSLPMYHVYGYVEGMLAVPWVGGAIVPRVAFDPRDLLAAIGRHRATDVLLVPTMTLALIDVLRREQAVDLSSLDAMISSGGYAPPSIWDAIDEAFGPLELTTGYGMTEVTATTMLTEPDDPPLRLRTSNGRSRTAGAAGNPDLAGALVRYAVVDPQTGEPVAPGEVGELVARGPGVTSGYYRKPEETAAAFDEDGWFHSGDLGRLDADGYLSLVGRSKDLYRCGGEQVVPLEVENLLATHPAVAQAFVVPLPHERMGEVGVAWVVLSMEPADVADREQIACELQEFCRDRLARFKVPAHVLTLRPDEVPLTPSGRPRKFLLAERAAAVLG